MICVRERLNMFWINSTLPVITISSDRQLGSRRGLHNVGQACPGWLQMDTVTLAINRSAS